MLILKHAYNTTTSCVAFILLQYKFVLAARKGNYKPLLHQSDMARSVACKIRWLGFNHHFYLSCLVSETNRTIGVPKLLTIASQMAYFSWTNFLNPNQIIISQQSSRFFRKQIVGWGSCFNFSERQIGFGKFLPLPLSHSHLHSQ